MQGLFPRVTPAVQLSRLSMAYSALTNAIFMVLWTRAVTPEAQTAATNITGHSSSIMPILAACLYSIGIYLYASILNDLIDARRDATRHPEKPIPSGAIRSNAAFLIVVCALLVGLAAATWLGTQSVRAAIVTSLLVLVYNATFKFLPAFSFTTLGVIHATHMLTINPEIQAVWPVVVVLLHTVIASSVAHVLARRRPRITSFGWSVIALGTLSWVALLLLYVHITHGSLTPSWFPGSTFIGPIVLGVLFAVFVYVKLRKVTKGKVAAEKLTRYAAIWTPLYATTWCFALSHAYPDLVNAGFVLAAISVLGLIGVTTLRELYAIVEHPVGYRR